MAAMSWRRRPVWWYLSFVDDDRDVFLGSAVVKGVDVAEAMANSWQVGVNPGCEVAVVELLDAVPDEVEPNRYYSLAEMIDLGHVELADLGLSTLAAWNE